MNTQRGLAVVETAIALPVFLFLMMTTAEIGRQLYHYNTVAKSVLGAARYLAERARNDAGVIDVTADSAATKNLVVYGTTGTGTTPIVDGLTTADVTVTSPDVNHVSVSVAYTYDPIIDVVPTFWSDGESITMGGDMTVAVTLYAA